MPKTPQILNAQGRPANEAPILVSPTGTPVTAEKPVADAPAEPVKLQITVDPEGFVYRWSESPSKKGQFVLYDVNGAIQAITASPAVADLICNALRLLALAHAEAAPTTTPPPTEG
jgi:hypothetical protein